MRRIMLAGAVALVMAPMVAAAGPFADFEGQLRDAYGNYRQALFLSNQDKAGPAAQALQDFSDKWLVLVRAWGQNPPPQYADDPAFSQTLATVNKAIDKAQLAMTDGNLTAAHGDLEAVRGALGDLHLRNGLMGFSDRVNAYHVQMEKVLKGEFAGADGMAQLAIEAGALQWLAQNIAAHPSSDVDDPAYAPLVKGLQDSVAGLVKAIKSGDLKAALEARGKLKPAYAKLFAKFG